MHEEGEEETEEEEELILVELHGVIDSEIFTQDSFGRFRVLAIDSERPVIQVENFNFSGEYQHTMGTAVFFEEEEKRLKCDPVFCKKPPRMLRYSCQTNKKLNMKRVFVSEKSGSKDVKREAMEANQPQDLEPLPDVMGVSTETAEPMSQAEQMQE